MSFLTMKGGETMSYISDISVLLANLLLVAFLTETVIEVLKNFVIRMKLSEAFVYTLSILVGVIIAFALQVSLFTDANSFAYYVGIVIAGLVASRGANYIHNFIGNLPLKK